jgi:hypothetical protein
VLPYADSPFTVHSQRCKQIEWQCWKLPATVCFHNRRQPLTMSLGSSPAALPTTVASSPAGTTYPAATRHQLACSSNFVVLVPGQLAHAAEHVRRLQEVYNRKLPAVLTCACHEEREATLQRIDTAAQCVSVIAGQR